MRAEKLVRDRVVLSREWHADRFVAGADSRFAVLIFDGAARRFFGRLQLCTLTESLGGVETLVAHPATMSHGSVLPDERAARGITDGLVGISVGIGGEIGDFACLLRCVPGLEAR